MKLVILGILPHSEEGALGSEPSQFSEGNQERMNSALWPQTHSEGQEETWG